MNIVVNLNKNHSITSHDAVTAVKKLFKVRKAGHAGTLDPIATGVLLVCLNEATKITGYLSDLDKEYIMTAKLGESTDTYDSEGKIIKRAADFEIAKNEVEEVIQRFIGDIEQVPPMHSAIKVSGKPLYKLARKGIEIERRPRKITINSIEILELKSPFLRLRISCSKGTYIRSLCNDIGNALGTGAHITELARTRIGDFTIEDSAKIDELPLIPPFPPLIKGGRGGLRALHTIDAALKHLSEVRLEGDNLKRAKNGNAVILPFPPLLKGGRGGLFVRLKDPDGKLFGIGRVLRDSIKIERLLKI